VCKRIHDKIAASKRKGLWGLLVLLEAHGEREMPPLDDETGSYCDGRPNLPSWSGSFD
jgi:hypothetical protein